MQRMRRIAAEMRAMPPREAVRELVHAYREDYLRAFACAIAFQVLFAIIPLTLFGLGLLGGLGLEEQWTEEWAATVRGSMSPDAFRVVDDAVSRALGKQQVFWMTAGAVLAIWQISATTRTIMDVFDRIYDCRRQRSFRERMGVSLLLGGAVTALLLAAAACVVLGDELLGEDSVFAWLRWPFALAMLFAVVTLLVAKAPADPPPARWVTFGSIVVVASWGLASLLLAWYFVTIADYDSIFGALATIVVVLAYVYVASLAVLIGAELDALVRDQVDDE